MVARFILMSVAALATACGGAASPAPPPVTGEPVAAEPISTTTTSGEVDLRSEEAVSEALGRAEAAYMEGRWGEVVVEAGRVMRGLAGSQEYYTACLLLGSASCRRGDPRPIATIWPRLLPTDQERLREECREKGITLDDSGKPVAPPT